MSNSNKGIFLIPLILAVFLSITSYELFNPTDKEVNSLQKLTGTQWNSQFYHYSNFYVFQTDSTGFVERGQVAWSLPIELDSLQIKPNEIQYIRPEPFNYDINDNVLSIIYLNRKPDDPGYRYNYNYDADQRTWISEDEYTYGKEYLRQGQKIMEQGN